MKIKAFSAIVTALMGFAFSGQAMAGCGTCDKTIVEVAGKTVTIDGAKVVKTDIKCKNGVIHVIDTVITPKS